MTRPQAASSGPRPVPPPVIVVDDAGFEAAGDGPSTDRLEALAAASLPDGWTLRYGFDLPDSPWDLSEQRWMCCGVIADEEQGAGALAALVRGVGLIVAVEGPSRFRLQVLDDLHHNGALATAQVSVAPVPRLAEDDETLIRALAEGATVEEAARHAMTSVRTAHRRLAAVREAYGASNTTEVVARWSEHQRKR